MDSVPVLTRQMARELLMPEGQDVSEFEELEHSWTPNPFSAPFPGPLLRTWDQISGSQPTDNRMIARDPNMRLADAETRRNTLGDHLYHGGWKKRGPYISFTSSAEEVQELVRMREKKRGPQTVTAINPRIRIQNGLPLLNVRAEMDHYGVPDPYKGRIGDYSEHYVCLWQVTSAEIIGQWPWSELRDNPTWYQDVVLAAYNESDLGVLPTAGPAPNAPDMFGGLLELFPNLSIANHPTEDPLAGNEDEDQPEYYGGYPESDTDDEVEEANREDDFLKAME